MEEYHEICLEKKKTQVFPFCTSIYWKKKNACLLLLIIIIIS